MRRKTSQGDRAPSAPGAAVPRAAVLDALGLARRARAAVTVVALAAAACSDGPYVIGAQDAPGDGPVCPVGEDCSGRFELDFSRTGVDGLSTMPLPGARFLLTLRGSDASPASWRSVEGHVFDSDAPAAVGLDAPFVDGTRAVGTQSRFVAADPSVADPRADDLFVEAVVRAGGGLLWSRHDGSRGVRLEERDGRLVLRLDDGGATLALASPPLTPGAWTHCAFVVRRATPSIVVCNGRAVTAGRNTLGGLGAASAPVVGGEGPAHLAWLALARLDPDVDVDVEDVRSRFFTLTGARARLAGGPANPLGELRAAPAFVDLARAPTAPRRLFLVGPGWPRVACRVLDDGARFCGYLAEGARASAVPRDPRDWEATGASWVPDAAPFVTDLWGMAALVADASASAHGIRFDAGPDGAAYALSFFARAGASRRLAVGVSGRLSIVVDVEAAAVVSAEGAVARVEDWGEGIVRVVVEVRGAGSRDVRITALDATGAEGFAGDGVTHTLYLQGLQLEANSGSASTLLFDEAQPADELVFAGGPPNLPTGGAGRLGARVLATASGRIHDGAVVNLNQAGRFEDQINLFVASGGNVLFWGLTAGDSHWSMGNPAPVDDGGVAAIAARWGGGRARLTVGAETSETSSGADVDAARFERIEVGFSTASSGPLLGLLGELVIGP